MVSELNSLKNEGTRTKLIIYWDIYGSDVWLFHEKISSRIFIKYWEFLIRTFTFKRDHAAKDQLSLFHFRKNKRNTTSSADTGAEKNRRNANNSVKWNRYWIWRSKKLLSFVLAFLRRHITRTWTNKNIEMNLGRPLHNLLTTYKVSCLSSAPV